MQDIARTSRSRAGAEQEASLLVLHDVCAENGEVERAADVVVEPERDAAIMSDSKGDDRSVERTLKWFIYTMGIVACVCSMSRVFFSVDESEHIAGNSVSPTKVRDGSLHARGPTTKVLLYLMSCKS